MRKATFPVLNGLGATLVAVPPISSYAFRPSVGEGGNTASRPGSPTARQSYYDTDLLEEIFYNVGRSRWENYMGDTRA